MTYDYMNISNDILAEFAKIPAAGNFLRKYSSAGTNKLRAIYGLKLFEIYATPCIWLMWYQSRPQSKTKQQQTTKLD